MLILFYANRLNSINPNLRIFLVTRFGSSSDGRIVEYNSIDDVFTCTCEYMAFSGIICRHIFCVATQLNIDSFSKKMYISRWCKDPNEFEMIQIYRSFYEREPLNNSQEIQFSEQPQLEQDYKYKLNRTIWKLQRFVNQKPETAVIFDETITLLLNAQIAAAAENCNSQINNNDYMIKIPQNVKPKGGVRSNKRKKSGMEINSQRKKSKKSKVKSNILIFFY